MFAHWSPKNERTRLISFANVGKPCSVAVNYPLTGYIAYVLGWQAVFYISGKNLYVLTSCSQFATGLCSPTLLVVINQNLRQKSKGRLLFCLLEFWWL